MIDFTIHHKKEPLNKVIAVELPMNADNLSDLLQELGYEPPEKLKVNSKGKPHVIELNSDTNMGFAIIERLCDNDTIAELNNLCAVICKCSDQDYIYQTIYNSDVRCINGIKKLLADRFMEFSDKLVLNTSLERKPTELAVKGCIIEKAIPVSHRKFEDITRVPLRDEPLIAENKNIMYFDSKYNMYHCLLIYDKDFGDGIVVNSEGSNYARYAQYVPQAKVIYEQHKATHLNELRICCPIEIYQHIYGYPKDNCILDNADMVGYVDDINSFIRENDLPAEHERGLMLWYIEANGMTMAEFVSKALDDELHPKTTIKEEKYMGNMRTMAFQIPEDLFLQIKDYLDRHHMTQKQFVLGLIQDELDRDYEERQAMAEKQQADDEPDEDEEEELDEDEDEELSEDDVDELDEDEDEDLDESEDMEESEDEGMSMEM